MRIIGLDLSLSRTGIALPDGQLRSLSPKATAKEPARRLNEIVAILSARLAASRPDMAAIEGYDLRPLGILSAIRLGELGGSVRMRLFELSIPYVEVTPNQLKLYATGRGNASKDDMLAAAQGCGAEPNNHDEADAFWLRALGVHAFDAVEPKYLRAELHDVRLRLLADLHWPAATRKRTA